VPNGNSTIPHGTLIDISEFLKKKKNNENENAKGFEFESFKTSAINLLAMDPATLIQLINFFISLATIETRARLGLISDDLSESFKKKPMFYPAIESAHQEASGGCYFCDKTIDPNETSITHDTPMCLFCRLKLANFMKAIGDNPDRVFHCGERDVQEEKIF
jgi:hypothetical protein